MTALPLIALAASAAGTGMQISAANSEKNAMNDKLAQEAARQQGYQKKASTAYQTSLAQSTPQAATQQWNDQTNKAMAEYQKVAGIPMTAAPSTGGGTLGIPDAGQTVQQASDKSYLQQLGGQNAQMQGQSGFNLAQYLKNLTAGQQIGAQSGIAQQSAGVLPYELQAAQNSQGTLTGAGQLLGALGNLMGIYGAVGGMPGGASGATQAAGRSASNSGYTPVGAWATRTNYPAYGAYGQMKPLY